MRGQSDGGVRAHRRESMPTIPYLENEYNVWYSAAITVHNNAAELVLRNSSDATSAPPTSVCGSAAKHDMTAEAQLHEVETRHIELMSWNKGRVAAAPDSPGGRNQ